MNKIACPVCSRAGKIFTTIGYFKTYKCVNCGHGFLFPGLKNERHLLAFYDNDYSKDYDPKVKTKNYKNRQIQYQLDVAFLKSFIQSKIISILDFGCSNGEFLKAMPSYWTKYGYERNFCFKTSKTVYSTIEESKKNKYDIITLRGVIEHLFNFDALFSLIKTSLKKNGIVYVCATPDFNSPCAVAYKKRWNQLVLPLHYHQFTLTSLTILFAKHGLSLKAVHYPYLETPYASFQKDSKKFINNIKGKQKSTNHAYPGNMMSAIFEKITYDAEK